MRMLNVKLLAILLGFVALTGVGVYFLHEYQVRRTARTLLVRAGRAEAQGHLDEAQDLLSRYLSIVPRDTEALAQYGVLLDRRATTPRARLQVFLTLEQVLLRAPGRHDLRRRLVDDAMALGRIADARKHLDILLKATPDDGDLEYRLGECDESDGDYEKAAGWYEKARKHAPRQLEAFERLARLQRTRLNAPERADQVMNEMVAANPDSYRASLERGRYRRQFHLAGAEGDLQNARAKAPDSADVLLEAARSAQEKLDPGAARRQLGRGLQLFPGDARMYQALAEVEVRSGRPDEAAACLRRGIKQLPGLGALRWALANLLAQRGETTELAEHLRKLREAGYPEGRLAYLDAYLRFNQGHWIEARTLLERSLPELAAWPELKSGSNYLLGLCYGQLGDFEQQSTAFRRAVNIDPLWMPARLGLAGALAAQGKTDQAIDEYRKLIAQAPEVRVTLARLLLARNLGLPADERRWDEVDRLLDDAARALPESSEPTILRAEALDARGRTDSARNLLRAARDRQPTRVEPWLALIDLAARRAPAASALALLADARRKLGDRIELRAAQVRIASAGEGAEALKELERQASDVERTSGDDRRKLLRALAAGFTRLGDHQTARRFWGQLAEREPDDLNLRLVLFDLAFRANDDDAMTRTIAEIRRIEGDEGTLWRSGQARLLIWRGGRGDRAALEPARALLATLAERRPDWPLVPLCLGEIDDQLGNPDGAVKNYLHAIDLGERSAWVIRRTAQHLYASQRYDEADRVIRKLPEASLLAGDLPRLAAGIALRSEDPARALDLARKAVAARPDDSGEHLWLGQVLWSVGHRAEAEAELRRAVALAETHPEPWIALVEYLARMGQKAKAEAAIEEAARKLSKEQAPAALARCFEAIGDAERARTQYQAALTARPDDFPLERNAVNFSIREGQLREAEARLRAIMARPPSAAADVAWARRTLTLVLATEGDDYQHAREALTLVGDGSGATDRGETVEDRRVRARVLVAQKTRACRKEAIQVLERLVERGPAAPDDQLLLAQLDEAEGDWLKAREQLQDLLAAQPRDPSCLAQYASGLLRRGQPDEARLLVDRLEQVEPKSLRTVALKARTLKDQGHADQAVDLLKATANDQETQAGPIAALLDGLGRPDESEALLRRSASQSKRPEAVLDLAEHLGRNDRGKEALDLCERSWPTCRPEAVARASALVIATSRPDDDQVRRAAARIEAAIAKAPQSTVLRLSLASVRESQGLYPEAEAIYRKVIETDPRDFVPLNNLAWLLAFRPGEGPEALALINRAIARAGPAPELLDTRGVVYLGMGQSDRAIEDLAEAVAGAPSAPKYFHLARAYLKSNDRPAAASALQKARAAGLIARGLHPLEKAAYRQVLGELAQK